MQLNTEDIYCLSGGIYFAQPLDKAPNYFLYEIFRKVLLIAIHSYSINLEFGLPRKTFTFSQKPQQTREAYSPYTWHSKLPQPGMQTGLEAFFLKAFFTHPVLSVQVGKVFPFQVVSNGIEPQLQSEKFNPLKLHLQFC